MTRKSYTPGGTHTQAFVNLLDAGNAQSQLIMQAIAQHADWETGECHPAVRALAEISKCSAKTVRRHLYKLKADGLIEMEERFQDGEGENGRQTSNKITLAGYAEWIAANKAGGKVRKPAKAQKYRNAPPGQDEHGVEEAKEKDPMDKVGRGLKRDPMDKVDREPVPKKTNGRGHVLTSHEPSIEQKDSSPPTPRKRGARERKFISIIEELKALGEPAHVLDHFIAPIARSLTIGHSDPRGLFKEICEALADKSERVLSAAARELISGKGRRAKIVAVKNAIDAVEEAETRCRIRITPKMRPQWAAWRAHYMALDRKVWVSHCEAYGGFSELEEWPPHSPEVAQQLAEAPGRPVITIPAGSPEWHAFIAEMRATGHAARAQSFEINRDDLIERTAWPVGAAVAKSADRQSGPPAIADCRLPTAARPEVVP